VVTAPCAAIREFSEGCVLYADPRSPDAIAAAVTEAASGSESVRVMRSRAAARAAEYTWRRTAEALWEVYRQAAQGGRPFAGR
jgi:glycosyltransferase involved in cell wall biosynthesis